MLSANLTMIFSIYQGHTCIIVFKYADNMEVRKEVEREFWFQTVSNATYSVDTFFFIRFVTKNLAKQFFPLIFSWFKFVLQWFPCFIHLFPNKCKGKIGEAVAGCEWNYSRHIPLLWPDRVSLCSIDCTVHVCIGSRWSCHEILPPSFCLRNASYRSWKLPELLVAQHPLHKHIFPRRANGKFVTNYLTDSWT